MRCKDTTIIFKKNIFGIFLFNYLKIFISYCSFRVKTTYLCHYMARTDKARYAKLAVLLQKQQWHAICTTYYKRNKENFYNAKRG